MTNAMKYAVGSNMPGYMPDSDPYEVETLDEAWSSCIADIELYLDEYDKAPHPSIQADLDQMKDATPQPCNAHFGNYVFWITEL